MRAMVDRGRFVDGISLGVLTRVFPRDLVDEVVAETGCGERRIRLLPARVVVYYVLGLSLFFGDSYEEVMRKLVNGLSFLGTWKEGWQVPTPGAISRARQRLGAAPLRALFERVAVPLGGPGTRGSWFHGFRVMAVDGVVLDIQDTPENVAVFGARRSGGYPQVRVVGIGECGTHAVVGAALDGMSVGERELLLRCSDVLEPGILLLADRGFYGYDVVSHVVDTGADLLWRVKDDLILPVLEWLPDGSYVAELLPSRIRERMTASSRPARADEMSIPVRVVEYMVTNRGESETIRLVTSIADHTLAPAIELAELYQQRWEFEITLDEIETHQIAGSRVLRSRLPELVEQEIWATLLTHYAIRHFMVDAADDLGEDPDRLSFIRTIRVVRRQVTNQAGFSP
ncbi:IS4 family transposase [Actinokineospora baliensis]|uniref:IS4 family transposase n=1 Tax=Actinokineospora baliensis TaxID=547056 RepID=UPI003558A830